MERAEREKKILKLLTEGGHPITGVELAKAMDVSRQVIVQDITILRSKGNNIVATNNGYIIEKAKAAASRVFKVQHTDEETQEELELFVDYGGYIRDDFVYHKVYNVIRGELNIRSRLDVKKYMESLKSGKSSLLKNVTAGYHYHTIEADSEETLDLIQEELAKRGFLAPLQDYEPVNFWEKG